MSLTNNRFVNLALIGAIAFATVPAVATTASAAGVSFDRCAGTAELPGARLDAAGERIFFGWINVGAGGEIAWTCNGPAGVTHNETDCGNDGAPMRWVRAELRNGTLTVACN
ncbi:MAG: hypothetical protein IT534_04880 [Bauldia sp.]|nr:hypothetical protein [Bauldia sp.]